MTDLVERLRDATYQNAPSRCMEAANEIERLRAFMGWVEAWASNPAASYSTAALDGLFGMTRDKIAALSRS